MVHLIAGTPVRGLQLSADSARDILNSQSACFVQMVTTDHVLLSHKRDLVEVIINHVVCFWGVGIFLTFGGVCLLWLLGPMPANQH